MNLPHKAYLNILTVPDERLRQTCALVDDITKKECLLLEDMHRVMLHFKGIGLSAPQIGVLKRMFVADIGEGPVKLINPQVVKVSGSDVLSEGCLSLPGIMVRVERPFSVTVAGFNESCQQIEVKANGLLAKVLQHEIDHLDGKLIIDFLPVEEMIRVTQLLADRKRTKRQ